MSHKLHSRLDSVSYDEWTTFATRWHSLIVRNKTVQVGNVQNDASGFIRFSTAKAVKAERHANRAVVMLHCWKTWDRDVNAFRNILMLTLHQVFERERPLAFRRDAPRSSSTTPLPPPDTDMGTQTVERFTKEATRNIIFENLLNLLHPPTLPKSNDLQSG